MPAIKSSPRTRETSATQGAGDLVLDGAPVGFLPFSDWGAGNYGKAHVTNGVDWEEGIYTYQAGPSRLVRTHIHRSSNGGAAVAWAAGTKTVRGGPISAMDIPRKTTKAVGGGAGTTVLTADEQRVNIIEFTGALTGNRTIEVDNTIWEWVVYNNTSGAFTLTFKVTGQAGVTVAQGKARRLHCNGVDVVALPEQEPTGSQHTNPESTGQTLADGANIAWNLDLGSIAEVTLGGNRTLSNPTNKRRGTYILIVKQPAAGGPFTLAYGTDYKFPSATPPVLSTAANAVDVLCFVSDGAVMRGPPAPWLDVR